MKKQKLFLLLSFTLILSTNIYGQAAVDIPLSATDGTLTYPLAVGLDLTATNCIDPQLGEHDNVWGPPSSIFAITFDLLPYGCPMGTDSFKDYRAPGNPPAFPFTGLVEHMLWWQVSSPGLPINITYNLPLGAIMWITDNITGTLLNLGPFTGQGVATIPGSYTAFGTKALLKMQYDNIIPVELTSFTASVLQNEKAIQLNWTTATETNNSGFEIQRTSPLPSPCQGEGGEAGRGWEPIGFIPGFGTTTEPKSYSFTDDLSLTRNLTHTLRYRLKQIDFDGSFEYSNEIEVEVDFTPKQFVLYQNYPNPFNPNTVISYQLPLNGNVTLKVYDVIGNEITTLINEEKQPGVYEVEFNAASISGSISAKGGYASGVYFYQLKAGNFSSIKKMVLLK